MNDEVKASKAGWKPWAGWILLAIAATGLWYWQSRPRLLWKIELGAPVMYAPAATDDTVYVCVTNVLKAFNSISGRDLWSFSHDYPFMVGPPVVIGRNVFVWSSKVYALNKDTGDELWHDSGQEVFCRGGENIVCGGWRSVTARDAVTGREKWTVNLDSSQMVRGLSAYGDILLVGYSVGGEQQVFTHKKPPTKGGMEAWNVGGNTRVLSADMGSAIMHGPLMIEDMVIGVTSGSRGRGLVAYDIGSQQVRWRVQTGTLVLPELSNISTQETNIALGTMTDPSAYGQVIVVGISDEYGDYVKAFSAYSGELCWRYEIKWEICRPPRGEPERSALTRPVVAGNAVYFGAGPYIVKLSADTGRCVWRFRTRNGSFIRQAPAVGSGVVCFATEDGLLYGIKDGK